MQYLAAFVNHLFFFTGVAGLGEAVDLRDGVERDLLRLRFGLGGAAVHHGAGLVTQFVHGRAARAGNRLIGVRDDAAEGAGLPQRMGHHHQRRGGTVGDRNDAVVPIQVLAIDFRHHQRDRRVHSESAGVVNDHGAGRGGDRPEPAGVFSARRDEHQVRIIETVIGGLGHGERLAVHLHLAAGGTPGGQEFQVPVFGVPGLDETQGFLADDAGSANDGEFQSLQVHFAPTVTRRWRALCSEWFRTIQVIPAGPACP